MTQSPSKPPEKLVPPAQSPTGFFSAVMLLCLSPIRLRQDLEIMMRSAYSFRLTLKLLLAILMMASGAIEILAARSASRTKLTYADSEERESFPEEEESENQQERRIEDRHSLERHREDRSQVKVHGIVLRLKSTSEIELNLSLRPADIGRTTPILC